MKPFAILRSIQEQPVISRITAALAWPFHRLSIWMHNFITWRIRVNGATIHSEGITLKFPPNVGVMYCTLLWWEGLGGYEPATWQLIKNVVPRGKSFMDIGSNIGLFAVLASKLSPGLAVDAFEPVPSLCDGNRRFHEANSLTAAHVHAMALSDHDGSFKMIVRSFAGHREAEPTSTLERDLNLSPGSDSREIDVATARLDTFLASNERPDPLFLKIDVEGHELAVLKGAEVTIRKRRPIIFCEILPVTKTAKESHRLVSGWDCVVCAVTRDGLFVVGESDMTPNRIFNDVLIVPREKWPGGNHLPYADIGNLKV